MRAGEERTPVIRNGTTSLLLAERFLKRRCLHQQGAVQTWQGTDLSTGADVVVKTAPLHALQVGAHERMRGDDEVLRGLRSPRLVPPFHAGVEGETLFRVRPHVASGVLAERLAKGPLSLRETLALGRGVSSALCEAHAQQVSHRHLKPANVVIPPQGGFEDAALIDFGLALEDHREASLRALPLAAIQYLAPEQLGLVSAEPGPASDLYAVGLLLFECLAGALPFPGRTPGELLRQHLDTVPELRARGLPVPRALEQVVQHLLCEEPRERYQTARAVLADLEDIASALERGLKEPAVVVGLSDRHPRLDEPAFIGRGPEVETLERGLTAAARGEGGLVLVEGVSGGGKTMLLEELEQRALARGARVYRGQAFDRAAPQPLRVLSDVLHGLASSVEQNPKLGERLRAHLADAVGEVPGLEALLSQSGAAFRSGGPEDLGEARAVRALTAVLSALGDAETPALVLLDDCQWADALTFEVLAALGTHRHEDARARRFVTVVAAFRTEVIPGHHPLRRMSSLARVSLAPLTPPELRDLAESMAGRLPGEALEVVERVSEGNPFMASALVRGLVESGALEAGPSGWRVVPERLAKVRSSRRAASLLLNCLSHLPEPAYALLAAGAILGREFDVDLAAALVGQEREPGIRMLEEARRRRLVWADLPRGRYTFVHDLIRETLLEQLPEERQRALHLAAALEWERRAPDASFEVAWHFEAAGALERAWPQALKAAEEARTRHTLDVAERYYRMADRGAVDADEATRMRILEGLGDVLRVRGDIEEAEASYARAQTFARTRLDRARLEGRRGETVYGRLTDADGYSRVESALRIIGQRVPGHVLSRVALLLWEVLLHVSRWPLLVRRVRRSSPLEGEALLRVQLLQVLCQTYWARSRPLTTSWWSHLHAMNLAERHAPGPELATCYENHGAGLALMTQVVARAPLFLSTWLLARARRYFAQVLAWRQARGDVYPHAITLSMYQLSLVLCSRWAESIEVGREALRLSQRAGAGHGWRADLTWKFLCSALFMGGDLPECLDLLRARDRTGQERDHALRRSFVLCLQASATDGRVPASAIADELARSREGAAYNVLLRDAELFQAEAHRLFRAGEPGRAVDVLERAGARLQASEVRSPPLLGGIRLLLVRALREQAARVPPWAFTVRAGLLREARAVAREACRRPMSFRYDLANIFRELGLMAAMEGHDARARRYFGRSLAIAERLGMRYERARTLKARAELGAALGWAQAAEDAAAAEDALRPMRAALEPAAVAEMPASLSLVDRFPRILDAGRAIASALTREAVCAAVREAVSGLLRTEDVVLFDVTPEGAFTPDTSGDALAPFLLRALEAERPYVPSTEELACVPRALTRSVLCAPILVRGAVAAVFRITNAKLAGAFGPEEVGIVEYIATLAGAALENARGFAEVKALSEERERALRKRDEFLAVASHELRTPFTPMRLYMQGLLSALRNPARGASVESWVTKLETANARLQRLAKLVEDLFDVSRLSDGRMPVRRTPVDLTALTVAAVDRWKDELARVKCECTLDAPEPVTGWWDGPRLEQVLDNLLGNAMKYGPGKPIHVSLRRHDGHARLVVRDEGLGIAPEDQARIFEKFERAVSENYGGFGLGLWISREVVRGLGGRILVDSTLGQGATFTVELPLAPPPGP